jgi:hypothetical protein
MGPIGPSDCGDWSFRLQMAPENALDELPFSQLGLVELYLVFAMRKLSVVLDLARSLTPQRRKRSAE